MKKTVMVMATIKIEGDDLSSSFIKAILYKIKKWFRYSHKQESDKHIVVSVELSDDFITLEE